MGVGSSEDKVSLELGVHDLVRSVSNTVGLVSSNSAHLANDVLVGESDNEPVLGRGVLVLRLGYEPLTCVVVGLSLCRTSGVRRGSRLNALQLTSSPSVLDLVPTEVGIVLDDLDVRHSAGRLRLATALRGTSPIFSCRPFLLCPFPRGAVSPPSSAIPYRSPSDARPSSSTPTQHPSLPPSRSRAPPSFVHAVVLESPSLET